HHDRTRRDRLALTAPRHDQPGTAGGRLLAPVLFPNPVPPAVAFCRRCFSPTPDPVPPGGPLCRPCFSPNPQPPSPNVRYTAFHHHEGLPLPASRHPPPPSHGRAPRHPRRGLP